MCAQSLKKIDDSLQLTLETALIVFSIAMSSVIECLYLYEVDAGINETTATAMVEDFFKTVSYTLTML